MAASVSAPASPPVKTPWRDVALVALVPALDAVLRLGRLHPDEVFQHLEPAMMKAYGVGITAWEWTVGLRNWAIPGLFALLLKLGDALGLHDVQARRALLEVPQWLLTVGMLGAVWRFANRRVGERAAWWSVLLVGLSAPFVWFAGRTLGESISTSFLVWGLERLDARDEKRAALWGGVLLGLAEVARYGSAAVIVPALVVLAAERRFVALGLATAGGAAVALLLGLLDKLTWGATLPNARWGGWWHSLLEYLDFNVFSGRAAQQFGASPWWFYAGSLFVAPFAVVGLVLWWKEARARAWLFAGPALAYLVAISATSHKEPRFAYPAVVLLVVAGTPAFAAWALDVFSKGFGARGLIASAAVLGAFAFFAVATPYDVQRPDQFQYTVKASRGGHGLVLVNDGVWGSGGAFYLGGALVFCACDFPRDPCFSQGAARDPRFDRGIYTLDMGNPQRNEDTKRAFEAIGFHLAESAPETWYFERGPSR
jgi:hypothetical protein